MAGCGASKKSSETEKTVSEASSGQPSSKPERFVKNKQGEWVKDNTQAVDYRFMDRPPLFPECDESAPLRERRQCLQRHMAGIFKKNFNTSLAEKAGKPGDIIYLKIILLVDKEGRVRAKNISAPVPELKKELERVVGLIPRLKPGYWNDKPAETLIFLPIAFKIKGDKPSEQK